ncbi:MAG: hypothetical protein WAO19_07065 [Candidatus Kryptoniota bacterium]
MAELNKSVIGKLRGSVGDIVFRQRNGKVFVSRKPKSFMPGTDAKSVERRLKFAFCAKLSKAIYSIPELAALWRQAAPQGRSVYHFILQTNIHLVNPDAVSEFTIITPPRSCCMAGGGFAIDYTNVSVSTNAIAVELASLGVSTGIDTTTEHNAKLACVLCLTNPVNKSLPQFQFVSCVSKSEHLAFDSLLTFIIALEGETLAKVQSYGEKKLLCAMVTLDSKNNPVRYSDTLVK